MSTTFEVILEKKGRGRGAFSLSRPWAIRTFKLKGQTLEYWDQDALKGTIAIAGATVSSVPASEVEGREFGFAIQTKEEKVMLNASSSIMREQCLEKFRLASANPNWATAIKQKQEQAAYEKAAEKAVASAFAEDLEKKRLENEMKELQKQQDVQVSSETANVFAGGLADKALAEARAAEEEQKRAQEAEAAALFGNSSAKRRFKEALARKRMDIAKPAAATMLQGLWRAKLAARQIQLKKAEKKRKLQDGYCRKIQARYRCRLARRKVDKIKAEKLEIKRKLCAMKVQSRWRIFMARKLYKTKQESKMKQSYSQSINRTRGIIKLQNTVRAFVAWRRISKMIVAHPSVALASIVRAENLVCSEGAELSAVISGMVLDVALDHPMLHRPQMSVPEEMLKTAHYVTSNYKIDNLRVKGSSDFNPEQALATAPRRMDFIVVTLIDKSSTAKDDFLGQAVLRISDLRKAMPKGTNTTQVTIDLNARLIVNVIDGNGINLTTVRKAGGGNVTINITLPDQNYSYCGWMFKVSESMLSSAWKRRWFVLINGELQYYNSEYNLESAKNVIVGKDVTALKEEVYKGRSCIKLVFTVDGKESFWQLDYDDGATTAVKNQWMRRLYRNCPALVDPTMDTIAKKLNITRIASVKDLNVDAGSGTSPMHKTKTPMSKRMSVFK